MIDSGLTKDFAFILTLLFILGLCIGSFLNVVIDRIPQGEALTGRSHCDKCRETLKWYDLIPLLSYIQLRGRCRYCNGKIPARYPFIEILTGGLFVGTFLFVGFNTPLLVYALFMMSMLIVIFFSDLLYGIIPDKILAPTVVMSLLYFGMYEEPTFRQRFLTGLGCFSVLGSLFFLTKGRGMGFGDVKFAFLIGLFLGWPLGALALYISFLTGGLISVMLLLYRVKRVGETVPFGPFLVTSTVLMYFAQKVVSQFPLL